MLTLGASSASGVAYAASDHAAYAGASVPNEVEQARVDRSEMLRYLGYAGQAIDVSLDERIDQAVQLCERVSVPQFAWQVFPIQEARDAQGRSMLRLAGSTLELTGESIREHLAGASECAVMACTLGLSNEREARRLAAVDPTAATLFSAAGSSLVEEVADLCSRAVLQAARERGKAIGLRFSPGYGDLPLALQPHIVRVLNADRRMGITPTEGGFVVPAKSVTAFIGLFDADGGDAGRGDTHHDGDHGARIDDVPQGGSSARPTTATRTCETCPARERCALRKMGTTCSL